eukprot:964144-Heterocapsa_arctica.AAC.1
MVAGNVSSAYLGLVDNADRELAEALARSIDELPVHQIHLLGSDRVGTGSASSRDPPGLRHLGFAGGLCPLG